MAADQPCDVDVTLSDPAAIVHNVADFLAGRCVQLAWATDVVTLWDPSPDARGPLGVHVAAAEVLGCSAIVTDRSVWLSCVHADTGDFFSVPWVELLAIGRSFGGQPSYALRKRVIAMSRLFGHSVEITTLDGWRFVGTVNGFEYNDNVDVVEVLVEPTDHVRFPEHPELNQYAVPMDQIDTIFDLGT